MTIELSSKERVRKALAHQHVEPIPFSWGFCATPEMNVELEKYFTKQNICWATLRDLVSDKINIQPAYTGPIPEDGNTSTGIWGIKLKDVSYGAGEYQEFTDFPLAGIEDPQELHDYPWPDPENYDYDNLKETFLNQNPESTKAVQYTAGNPFEIYCWMTGLEEVMINTLVNPEVVKTGLSYITNFFNKRLERVLEHVGEFIDIVFFADDLGSQTGLLISRESYQETLQPFHKKLTGTVRRFTPHAYSMLHSDGAVFDILPDLIDAGFQVHEAVQTDAEGMQPERLKSTYGDKLSFHGGISVQQLLPNNDVATVKRECQRLVNVFGESGGYIAAPTHAIQMGTPPENVQAMLEGVLGDGRYNTFAEQAVNK